MKNSTQITFAFQDSPESGDNPGVGVRIKSLKKTGNEATKEGQPELAGLVDKPTDPELFREASGDEAGETLQQVTQTEPGRESEPGSPSSVPEPESFNTSAPGNRESEAATADAARNPESVDSSEDAELPVFRGSSQIAVLTKPEEVRIETNGAEGNESENIEAGDEVDSGSLTEKSTKSTRGRKSLKNIDEGAELINVPPDEILFQKQYYAIGEVAEMFHVNQSLLRFWETEFDIIQPRKNRKGDRHFRPVDIKNLLLIHDLLRRRKLTIEGAKDFLKKNKRSPERFAMIQSLQKIKGFILEIKATL
jgi:DNA-binding transcriptional MerR regulator